MRPAPFSSLLLQGEGQDGVCGRRWGKTTVGIALAVSQTLDGKRVWWVAPT